MRKPFSTVLRLASAIALAAAVFASTNCMTSYDAYGRPMQTVDPGVAIAGVAAAGILGYALAENHNDHYHHGGYGGGYYRPHY